MANKLAQTVFQTGPSDELAAHDVYKSDGNAIITSVQVMNEVSSSLTMGSQAVQQAAKEFSSIVEAGKEFIVDKAALADRLNQAAGEFASEFRELAGDIKEGISTAMGVAGKVMTTVNGVKAMVNNFDIRNLSSVGALINKVAQIDAFKLIDTKAIESIYTGVIAQATKLGIPNAFGAIADTIGSAVALTNVVRTILPGVIKSSDIGALESIANSKAAKLVSIVDPSFTRRLTGNYQAPKRGMQANTRGEFSRISQSFAKISPSWNKKTRSGDVQSAIRILDIIGGSNDFKKVVYAGAATVVEPHAQEKYYCLASKYKEVDPVKELKINFPTLTLLSPDEMTRNDKSVTDTFSSGAEVRYVT